MAIRNKDGALYFATGIDNSGLRKDSEEAKRYLDDISDFAKSTGRALGAAFSVVALKQFANEIINVRGEMQMLETSFDVLLGGRGVDGFMKELNQFAIDSPLSLSGVANAAQTLLAFNVEAEKTIPIIKQIGDISMGNEQRFSSLALAFAQMTSLGKLMGQDLNQMINAGFNPLQEMSARTGKSIAELRKEMESGAITSDMVADAFRTATEEGGKFHGMTQKQADGIKGLQAQLEGAWQENLNEIGKNHEDLIVSGYKAAISLSENYEKIGRAITALIATYGAYKAAIVTITVAERGWTIAQMTKYRWLVLVERAQKMLNATMLKNPYVLAATALMGLVSAVIAFRDRSTEAEKAQERVNKVMDEASGVKESLMTRSSQLISVLKDETATVYQQVEAYKELIKMLPDDLKGKSFAEVQSMSSSEIQKLFNQKADADNKAFIQGQYNQRVKEVEAFRKAIKKAQESESTEDDENIFGYRKALNASLNDAKLLKQELDKINETEKQANFLSLPREEQRKQLEAQRDVLVEMRKRIEGGKSLNPFEIDQNSADQIASINSQINELNESIATYNEAATIRDKAYWEEVKKTAEESRALIDTDNVGNEEWNQLTEKIKEADDALKHYSTTSREASKDVQAELQKRADLQARIDEQNSQRLNESKRLELELWQYEISLMEEGYEKSVAIIELEKKRELQSIEERKQSAIKANQDIERAEWERSGGKGVFTAGAGLTEEQSSTFERLQEQVNERERVGKEKLLEELIEKYRTHEQQRSDIIRKYEAERTRLASENIDGKLDDNIEVLNKQEQAELAAFDTQIQAKTSIMTRMFSDMSDKSIEELKRIREEAESLWEFLSGGQWDDGKGASFGISKEQFEDIIADPEKMSKFKKGIDDIRGAIFQLDTPIEQIKEGLKELFNPDLSGTNRQLDGLNKIQKGYQKYADAVSLVSGAIGSLADLTGSGALKSVSDGLDDVLAVAGEAMSGAQVGAQVGGAAGAVVGGILGAAKGIFTVISDNKKHQEELKRQIQENIDKEYFGQLEVEELYRRKYEWAKKIGETTLNHIKREGEELKKQAAANQKAQNDLWNNLRREQYKSGERFEKTGLFGWGKGKIVEEWSSLAGKSWEQIETLAAQGKLSEEGMKFYEALKAAKEEGQDLEAMQMDYLERLREVTVGSPYDSIVTGIVDGFKQGKRSAADFANSFEDLMQGAIQSSLNMLADAKVRKWYEDFANAGEDGYTAEEIEKAKQSWIKINEELEKQAKQLEEVTGRSFGDANDINGVSGELKAAMTEQTGTRLVGLWNMTAMDTREIKEYLKSNPMKEVMQSLNNVLSELQAIRLNTGDTASNTGYLETGLRALHDKLEKIERNTKQNNSRG